MRLDKLWYTTTKQISELQEVNVRRKITHGKTYRATESRARHLWTSPCKRNSTFWKKAHGLGTIALGGASGTRSMATIAREGEKADSRA